MSNDKGGLGGVEFAGKVKTQTFKQFELEQLIKDGTVIPASKLAEAKGPWSYNAVETLRHP